MDDLHHSLPDEADAYALRQRARDEAYRQAYLDWIGSLPPEERAQLGELGLDRPSVPGCGTGAPSRDMAESSLASCDPDEAGDDDPWVGESSAPAQAAEPTLPEFTDAAIRLGAPDPEFLHDLLRRLVGELIGQDNARLSLECLALVTGLAYCGDSMTDIAKRHGVTRAAVSKRCVELTRALNLKPSRAMRSVEARQSYRQARMRHLSGQD